MMHQPSPHVSTRRRLVFPLQVVRARFFGLLQIRVSPSEALCPLAPIACLLGHFLSWPRSPLRSCLVCTRQFAEARAGDRQHACATSVCYTITCVVKIFVQVFSRLSCVLLQIWHYEFCLHAPEALPPSAPPRDRASVDARES